MSVTSPGIGPGTLPPGQARANLTAMASMLIWATGFPAVDLLLPVLPPVWLVAARMALAAAALLPLWLMLDGMRAVVAAPWRAATGIGAVGFGLGAFLLILAQDLTDAVTAAVITATLPVVGIAMEALFDGRRVTGRLVAGLVLSLAGGLLAYAAGIGALKIGPGAIFAFLSVLVFAWGSRRTAVLPLSVVGQTTITLIGAALAATLVAGLSAATGGALPQLSGFGPAHLGALLAYGLASLALSQVLWIVAVTRLGIGVASMHINIAPFYVMLFALALGGSWDWWQAAGAALVGLGVIVAQSR